MLIIVNNAINVKCEFLYIWQMLDIKLFFFVLKISGPFLPVMSMCICISSRKVRPDHKWSLETDVNARSELTDSVHV